MSIKLKKHNRETYKKVLEIFKRSDRAAVIHPTGTGKSYIALKLLEDNKNKKAIYVAPSNSILHNIKKNIFESGMNMSDFPNLKRITYSKLANLSDEEIKELGAEIIILDEFHHCGAPEWGKGVSRLLEASSKAKVLGLSATPIRYFDKARDMAEELFGENIASEMSLEEAIEKGILPSAKYVSALYSYTEELDKMKDNISRITNPINQAEAQRLFKELKQKLDENTENLPELLAKYMKNKNGKYIVFCKDIEDMKEKMKKASEMFGGVNSNIKIYSVSSENDLRKNDKILTDFENDKSENSLKLMFSVNMLNEGYHINDLDGVVMMRPTFSPTIFAQQLGRALTVKKEGKGKPVIIDLVNNFDSCKIIEDFCTRVQESRKNAGENSDTKEKISIFDNTKEFRDIAAKITSLYKRDVSLDEKIEIMKRFAKTGEELSGTTIFEGYAIGTWAIQIRSSLKRGTLKLTEKQQADLDELNVLERKFDSTLDEKIEDLIEWNNKYPLAKIREISLNDVKRILAENYIDIESITDEDVNKEKIYMDYDYARITGLYKLESIDDMKKVIAYQRLFEKYSKMRDYYSYIRIRFVNGKLTPEQIEKCKEGGIRGVFGYPSKVEELSKKYNADPEIIINFIKKNEGKENIIEEIESLSKQYRIDENKIIYILNKYGTMQEFLKRYIFEKTGEFQKLDKEDTEVLGENLVSILDVSLQGKKDLDEFASSIMFEIASKYKFQNGIMGLYNAEKFLEQMKLTLPERTVEIIFDRFGIRDGKKMTHDEIAQKYNISRSRAGQIEKRSIVTIARTRNKINLTPFPRLEELKEEEILEILNSIGNSIFVPDKKYENVPSNITTKDMEKIVTYINSIRNNIKQFNEECATISTKELSLSEETYNYLISKGIYSIDSKIIDDDYVESLKIDDFDKIAEIRLAMEEYRRNNRKSAGTVRQQETTVDVKALRDTPIENLMFGIRATNALRRSGFQTFGEIMSNRYKLYNIRNLGRKSTTEILEMIEEYDKELIEKARATQEFSTLPIDVMGLKEKTYNALVEVEITTVQDLINKKDSLSDIDGLGKDTISETLARLKQLGLDTVDKTVKENKEEQIQSVEMDPSAILIEELHFSTRVYNALTRREGIRTLKDLIEYKDRIRDIRNLGEKSVNEIFDKLKMFEESRNSNPERQQKEAALQAYMDEDEMLDETLAKVRKMEQLEKQDKAENQNKKERTLDEN